VEALIRSHISFTRPAVSYYRCDECVQYHLTSRGEEHSLLSKPEIVKRIKSEQQAQDWSGRFKRK